MKSRYLTIAFCMVIFASCATQNGERVVRKNKRVKAMGDAKMYKETVANYLDFNTLNLKKIDITYEEGNKKQSFRGSVRISKDSIIWLSISKLGIEGMRVKLTPDSVSFVDRLHREYMITDYSYLNQKFNLELDFYLLQSILTNQLPEYRIKGNLPFFRKFKGKKTKTHYIFYSKKRHEKKYWKVQKQTTGNKGSTLEILRITPDLMRLESIDIFDMQFFVDGREQAVNFNLQYMDYKKYDEKYLFPEKIATTVRRKLQSPYRADAVRQEKIKITIVVDKLQVNDRQLSFPFKISSKYKRINE